MKTTRIYAQVFTYAVTIDIKKKDRFLSLEEALEHVQENISDTGDVKKIDYLEGDKVVKEVFNANYTRVFVIKTNISDRYISPDFKI